MLGGYKLEVAASNLPSRSLPGVPRDKFQGFPLVFNTEKERGVLPFEVPSKRRVVRIKAAG